MHIELVFFTVVFDNQGVTVPNEIHCCFSSGFINFASEGDCLKTVNPRII